MTEQQAEAADLPTATRADVEQDVLDQAAAAVEPLEQAVDFRPLDNQRRVLLVHAHPDDETILTGATMARHAAAGDLVALVTCTLGELGEVVPDELRHLAADADDRLGEHRVEELAVALEALQVTESRFLGGPGRWRDSGMAGEPSTEDPRAFCNADVDEAVAELVAVVREVRPQVVVGYGDDGGYGHPDHVQAARVTGLAVAAAADPSYGAGLAEGLGEPWQVAKRYAVVVPQSVLAEGMAALREHGADTGFAAPADALSLGYGVPDDEVTTEVDGAAQRDAKLAALRAHRTQLQVDGGFYALSDGVGQQVRHVEYFLLLEGDRAPGDGPQGREDDLFAGLEV